MRKRDKRQKAMQRQAKRFNRLVSASFESAGQFWRKALSVCHRVPLWCVGGEMDGKRRCTPCDAFDVRTPDGLIEHYAKLKLHARHRGQHIVLYVFMRMPVDMASSLIATSVMARLSKYDGFAEYLDAIVDGLHAVPRKTAHHVKAERHATAHAPARADG